jgi:hypothetical protein
VEAPQAKPRPQFGNAYRQQSEEPDQNHLWSREDDTQEDQDRSEGEP